MCFEVKSQIVVYKALYYKTWVLIQVNVDYDSVLTLSLEVHSAHPIKSF